MIPDVVSKQSISYNPVKCIGASSMFVNTTPRAAAKDLKGAKARLSF